MFVVVFNGLNVKGRIRKKLKMWEINSSYNNLILLLLAISQIFHSLIIEVENKRACLSCDTQAGFVLEFKHLQLITEYIL